MPEHFLLMIFRYNYTDYDAVELNLSNDSNGRTFLLAADESSEESYCLEASTCKIYCYNMDLDSLSAEIDTNLEVSCVL